MKKLLSLKGRERLQYELDKLMNDPDINIALELIILTQMLRILMLHIGK